MQVLAFRHAPFESLGRVADSLIAHDIPFEYADLYLPGSPTPDWAKYDGLIFLGGPMSVNDDLSWLAVELDVIGRAVRAGQPVLGICLGAQLLAKALGAEVRRNPEREIGWYPISCTASAEADRLFTGLRTEYVFHWHGETFDLPPGGELLATSERCRNQAFRVGERLYGIQFHLEVTPEMIEDWCHQGENCADLRELVVPVEPRWHYLRMEALAGVIFGRWCDMLRGNHRGNTLPAGVVPEFSMDQIKADQRQLDHLTPDSDRDMDRGISQTTESTENPKLHPGFLKGFEPDQFLEEEQTANEQETSSAPFGGVENPMCPGCGWRNTRRSHSRGFLDSVLRAFAMRAFRCRSCGIRFRVVRRDSKA